mmetsp:Transcript_5958/g.10714  ORF Transcript_5958/g.10714 Transcript_5958/m.10714 type:complete len:184 (+) Transcript_5958:104-655(+)
MTMLRFSEEDDEYVPQSRPSKSPSKSESMVEYSGDEWTVPEKSASLERKGELAALLRHLFEETREKLGLEHESTITALLNLAALLQETRKLDEAEQLYKNALEHSLSQEDKLRIRSSLASMLKDLGRNDEAEQQLILAVECPEVSPEVQQCFEACVHDLIFLLQEQGRIDEAAEIQNRFEAEY